jgi:hypothetical protein
MHAFMGLKAKQTSLSTVLQGFNVCLARREPCLARLYFSTIQLDHAGTTVSTLTVDGDLDAHFIRHGGEFLSGNGVRNGLAIDRHLLVELGAALQACVRCLSEAVVALEGIAQSFEEVETSRRDSGTS